MDFSAPHPRRSRAETFVPMINVVFLLLIFFLMTAQIAPPEPFEVTPPLSAEGDAAADPDMLFVAADGRISYADVSGEAVWAALAKRDGDTPLAIRADAATKAADLAGLLPRLRAVGITKTLLVTRID